MTTWEQKALNAAKSRRHRERNLERAREHSKAWRARQDPEALRARNAQLKRAWMAKPINRMRNTLSHARQRASASGVPFEIDVTDLLPLPETCPALGIKINYAGTGARGFINDSPSIDRVNPALGYVKGNVRVISWRANRIKSDASIDELRALLRYMELPCN